MAENNRKRNISGDLINDNRVQNPSPNNLEQVGENQNNEQIYVEMNAIQPNEEQVVHGNCDGVAENIDRVEARELIDRENIERANETVETQILRFTQQYPIARRLLRQLSVLALVNLCVVYPSIFDFLSVENQDIRTLCECFDLVSVFRNIPRTARVIELLERFRPNNVIFRHTNEGSTFHNDILRALRPLELQQLFITVLNRNQELEVNPIRAKKIVLVLHPLHTFQTLINSVLRSANENLDILIIENGGLNDMTAVIFSKFLTLCKLFLINTRLDFNTPSHFAGRLLTFGNLTELRIRCIYSFNSAVLNQVNEVLLTNIRILRNLETLELTPGPANFRISEIEFLPRLQYLCLNLEMHSLDSTFFNIISLLQRLERLGVIKIILFCTQNVFFRIQPHECMNLHSATKRILTGMHLPNMCVKYYANQ